MKKTSYVIGFLAAFLMASGVLFLRFNWPGGNRILLWGCVALIVASTAVYIPARKESRQQGRLSRIRITTGYLAALLIASGTIFKLLYLAPANLQILLGGILLILVFIPLYFYELYTQNLTLEQKVRERTREITMAMESLDAARQKSDELLRNILPEEIADELKERGATTAHQFDHVSVLFTDFVNFTTAGERMGSQALVEELHNCFKAFDEIIDKYSIEKIKTIGDAYLAVCGLPVADGQHAEKVVKAAQDILAFMQQRRAVLGDRTFEIRIGIHSGSVVAGIVGVKKFAYDIWGDTVNTAARMEQSSKPGKINISQHTYELVQDQFNCVYRGEIAAKNKGVLKMYFVEGNAV